MTLQDVYLRLEYQGGRDEECYIRKHSPEEPHTLGRHLIIIVQRLEQVGNRH